MLCWRGEEFEERRMKRGDGGEGGVGMWGGLTRMYGYGSDKVENVSSYKPLYSSGMYIEYKSYQFDCTT